MNGVLHLDIFRSIDSVDNCRYSRYCDVSGEWCDNIDIYLGGGVHVSGLGVAQVCYTRPVHRPGPALCSSYSL